MTNSTLNETLTRISGFKVGHAHNLEARTGCTVILCPPKTVGGVDQRGGSPGTRETDLLRPLHAVQHVNAILLSGGSAYGLAAADGVMRYLEEQGIGYPTPAGVVPIVPAAILYDLAVGDPKVRPDAAMGYAASEAASDAPIALGSVGAGAGATVGKLMGPDSALRGGIGSACIDLGDGLYVAALVAVNALGDVVAEDGSLLAGVGALNILPLMARLTMPDADSNTVIGVVATNAKLDKDQTNKMAQLAHDGLARAIRPAHTMFDGDTIFGLASGQIEANPLVIGAFAAEVMATAIRRAV
ncbi:MAG: P1 family peptidase [Anaerolineae bacterium]|nr:P1 family peptidase [Anaerolineae bacterium]